MLPFFFLPPCFLQYTWHMHTVMQSVPGSYELSFAAKAMIAHNQANNTPVDAVVCIGTLIKGKTLWFLRLYGLCGYMYGFWVLVLDILSFKATSYYLLPPLAHLSFVSFPLPLVLGSTQHFEYICESVTQGLKDVGLQTGVPVIFGILTVHTEEQALEVRRVGVSEMVSGWLQYKW